MKRILAVVMCIALSFAMIGCADKTYEQKTRTKDNCDGKIYQVGDYDGYVHVEETTKPVSEKLWVKEGSQYAKLGWEVTKKQTVLYFYIDEDERKILEDSQKFQSFAQDAGFEVYDAQDKKWMAFDYILVVCDEKTGDKLAAIGYNGEYEIF